MNAVNAVQRERGTAETHEDRGGVDVLVVPHVFGVVLHHFLIDDRHLDSAWSW